MGFVQPQRREKRIFLSLPRWTFRIAVFACAALPLAGYGVGYWAGFSARPRAPSRILELESKVRVESAVEAEKALSTPPIHADLPPSGYLGWQLGAFPNRAEAEGFVAAWVESLRGWEIFIVPADIGERGRYYRVRAGKFGDRARALDGKAQLPAALAEDALLVVY